MAMDPYERLHVSLNPDGSLTRHLSSFFATTPSSQDPDSPFPSLSKDLPLNPSTNTSLRLFLPKSSAASSDGTEKKLPVVLYIHAGGFIMFAPSTSPAHAACARPAAHIPALVLSLDYRLAPEHRLPAAYDDAADALLWLRDQAADPATADPWIRDHADFSRCFLMGCSAGANVAFHLGLRSLEMDLGPALKLGGLILNEPYFGGVDRTESEARSEDDGMFPLASNYLMWELALPAGASRDCEYCNPATYFKNHIGSAERLPRCLVKGFVGDPLYDREKAFVEALRGEGVEVVALMEDQGFHGIELVDPSKEAALAEDCRKFICSS